MKRGTNLWKLCGVGTAATHFIDINSVMNKPMCQPSLRCVILIIVCAHVSYIECLDVSHMMSKATQQCVVHTTAVTQ